MTTLKDSEFILATPLRPVLSYLGITIKSHDGYDTCQCPACGEKASVYWAELACHSPECSFKAGSSLDVFVAATKCTYAQAVARVLDLLQVPTVDRDGMAIQELSALASAFRRVFELSVEFSSHETFSDVVLGRELLEKRVGGNSYYETGSIVMSKERFGRYVLAVAELAGEEPPTLDKEVVIVTPLWESFSRLGGLRLRSVDGTSDTMGRLDDTKNVMLFQGIHSTLPRMDGVALCEYENDAVTLHRHASGTTAVTLIPGEKTIWTPTIRDARVVIHESSLAFLCAAYDACPDALVSRMTYPGSRSIAAYIVSILSASEQPEVDAQSLPEALAAGVLGILDREGGFELAERIRNITTATAEGTVRIGGVKYVATPTGWIAHKGRGETSRVTNFVVIPRHDVTFPDETGLCLELMVKGADPKQILVPRRALQTPQSFERAVISASESVDMDVPCIIDTAAFKPLMKHIVGTDVSARQGITNLGISHDGYRLSGFRITPDHIGPSDMWLRPSQRGASVFRMVPTIELAQGEIGRGIRKILSCVADAVHMVAAGRQVAPICVKRTETSERMLPMLFAQLGQVKSMTLTGGSDLDLFPGYPVLFHGAARRSASDYDGYKSKGIGVVLVDDGIVIENDDLPAGLFVTVLTRVVQAVLRGDGHRAPSGNDTSHVRGSAIVREVTGWEWWKTGSTGKTPTFDELLGRLSLRQVEQRFCVDFSSQRISMFLDGIHPDTVAKIAWEIDRVSPVHTAVITNAQTLSADASTLRDLINAFYDSKPAFKGCSAAR